jgi:glycosyltransferase involved in cell wall biosynthesis
MKVLLIGEYSRLHNSLKEGLEELGHAVTLVSTGDGFKKFPSDHSIAAEFFRSPIPNLLRQAIFRVFRYDLAAWEHALRFKRLLPDLRGYDVVQLVSETPLFAPLEIEYKLLKKLRSQNGKLFVLCSGTDHVFMDAATRGKFRYSLLDPYLKNPSVKSEYLFALPHLKPRYETHHKRMMALAEGMVATDIDYTIALEGRAESLGMVPNPVNVNKIAFNPKPVDGKIVIFHGINRWAYHKKGNAYFEKALEIVREKYGEKIEIIQTENVPYDDYIKLYDRAHIVLDQVYAYDQGYNALEAMAKGKVVFTGAEKEFMEYYGLSERVAVNALPDEKEISAALSFLIENPAEIRNMGRRARAFIEWHHDYTKIAGAYLEVWNRVIV